MTLKQVRAAVKLLACANGNGNGKSAIFPRAKAVNFEIMS